VLQIPRCKDSTKISKKYPSRILTSNLSRIDYFVIGLCNKDKILYSKYVIQNSCSEKYQIITGTVFVRLSNVNLCSIYLPLCYDFLILFSVILKQVDNGIKGVFAPIPTPFKGDHGSVLDLNSLESISKALAVCILIIQSFSQKIEDSILNKNLC
jgi:hypothetical protein